MSVYKGAQGKGARQRHRDELYRAAVGRQLLNLDRGYYLNKDGFACIPAPIEGFLRRGDSVDSCDWRSWVVDTSEGLREFLASDAVMQSRAGAR